eukprot:SAG22_NODE_34_length_27479_cov_10.947480_3_plen_601_part_00
MASTVSADKNADEYAEVMDTPEEVARKVRQLAKLVKKYRGDVVFVTGAGISTSCGIPDFRSGLGSATGMPAGKWCIDATQKSWTAAEKQEHQARAKKTGDTLCAIPSPSHMALVALQRVGVTSGLISQNCDGLHRRSAFPPGQLAELHGCGNLEYCGWCGQDYLRDYSASRGRHTQGRALKRQLWAEHSKQPGLINPRSGNHYTGRRCQVAGCGGYLFDSTIDFGDNLPEAQLAKAEELAAGAKLCVVLGSRCAVSPACEYPLSVGRRKGSHLVVVNLQRTHADADASLRIGAKIDDVMVPLMAALGLDIPSFTLCRRVKVRAREVEVADEAQQRRAAANQAAAKTGIKKGFLDNTKKPAPAAAAAAAATARRVTVLEFGGVDPAGLPADTLWNVQATLASNPDWTPTHYNHRTKVVFNGDALRPAGRAGGRGMRGAQQAAAWPIVPGDGAEVALLPWQNERNPGKLAVNLRGTMRSASRAAVLRQGKELNAVPADIADVVDETVQSGGFLVRNAGSKHGAELLHRLALPAAAEEGLHCRSIALMFRGHYLEPPLPLPLDQLPAADGEEFVFDLDFDPATGVWQQPRRVDLTDAAATPAA